MYIHSKKYFLSWKCGKWKRIKIKIWYSWMCLGLSTMYNLFTLNKNDSFACTKKLQNNKNKKSCSEKKT